MAIIRERLPTETLVAVDPTKKWQRLLVTMATTRPEKKSTERKQEMSTIKNQLDQDAITALTAIGLPVGGLKEVETKFTAAIMAADHEAQTNSHKPKKKSRPKIKKVNYPLTLMALAQDANLILPRQIFEDNYQLPPAAFAAHGTLCLWVVAHTTDGQVPANIHRYRDPEDRMLINGETLNDLVLYGLLTGIENGYQLKAWPLLAEQMRRRDAHLRPNKFTLAQLIEINGKKVELSAGNQTFTSVLHIKPTSTGWTQEELDDPGTWY